jgi:fatty-acyl-CoA synthase
MESTMMDFPLSLPHVLERAGRLFPKQEIVSRLPDRSVHRYTYADFYRRARSLAAALQKAGLKRGDRVATLMWNHYVHLEAYYGIPCAGGVVHTLNLRLAPTDLAYIANHAGDRFLIVDEVLLPLFEKIRENVKLEGVIVVGGEGKRTGGYESYEDLLQSGDGAFEYPDIGENDAASMCYTSGTTGFPKGVVYSHRSLVLHATMTALGDMVGYRQADSALAVVPMFHANAWGMPFAATMTGCKQVLPGCFLDAESLLNLFESERVTVCAGVPTVALALAEALEKCPGKWRLPGRIRMLCGGAAPPEILFRRLGERGIDLIQGWGLTESSPVATICTLRGHMEDWPDSQKAAVRTKAGIPLPFVEMRVVGENGEMPHDGACMGEVELRGPWVAGSYYDLP